MTWTWMTEALKAVFKGAAPIMESGRALDGGLLRPHAAPAPSRHRHRPARSTPAQVLTPVRGRTDAVCPSCEASLGQMPDHKMRCPHCAKLIYVRTRPADLQRILVTKADLPSLRAQWALLHPAIQPRPEEPALSRGE